MVPHSLSGLTSFGYLFPDLQEDPTDLLPRGSGTLRALDKLGRDMVDTGNGESSDIPAAYTYFGQFVDHDIVMEARSDEIADIASPDLEPLLLQNVLFEIKNTRSAALDLDSVYGPPALRQGEKLRLGEVSEFRRPVPPDDPFHDLFRQGHMPGEPGRDRQALIGDPRNDENLIIAQLHVAFLRAHKALVERSGMSFEQARRTLRQHYQWIVIHDFLPRVVDPGIFSATLAGARFYDPLRKPFFLPLEFTAAAFRFGHSMVRQSYRHNEIFENATLKELFTFTALSGDFNPPPLPGERVPAGGFETLPSGWIIDWSGFVGPEARNKARLIDTNLAEPLLELPDMMGQVRRDEARLAVRNLRRGYLMRIPTGQAVARRMGLEPLTPNQIRDVTTLAQSGTLADAGLLERTPLWFYILAEAKHHNRGERLGPVGSTLVAEVLIGLVRRSEDSILAGSGGWRPSLGPEGRFDLPDLLRLAGVLPPDQPAIPPPT
ncbi:MAG TPA: heme peroxidase family protein [Thermoanaerobaculia bacterium]|nr:heme peroxidase family protein [Thermoanaerobaculia bacterium]